MREMTRFSFQCERLITPEPSRVSSRLPTVKEIAAFKSALKRNLMNSGIAAKVTDSKGRLGIIVELREVEADDSAQAQAFATHLLEIAMGMSAAEFGLSHLFGDSDQPDEVASR